LALDQGRRREAHDVVVASFVGLESHGERTSHLSATRHLSPATSSKNVKKFHHPLGEEMKASRFTEEQIIGFLREQEAGRSGWHMPQVRDQQRIFFKWKAKCGSLEV
jgi:hypothetical protein